MAQHTTRAAQAAELQREIADLERVEVHIQTNQGTYGPTEACRKVGTGDPRFANREVYETVSGRRRETGPAEGEAPGRMRDIGREELSRLRRRLADLRAQSRAAK